MVSFEDAAYSGGSILQFNGTIEDSPVTIRLFETASPVGDSPVYVSYKVSSNQ